MNIIKNKIQAGFIIVSSIISIIQILCFFAFEFQKNIAIWFILPTILICLFCILENKISKENSVQCLFIFINTFIILFLQLGLCSILNFTNFDNKTSINVEFTNTNQYTSTMKSIHSKMTRHFPSKIPVEAQNVSFFCSGGSYFGGRVIYLKFDTTEENLKNKISKYKYVTIIEPYDNINKYRNSYARDFIIDRLLQNNSSISGYKFYIIGNNLNTKNCHKSCEYGIAINKQSNTIIYYASNPD